MSEEINNIINSHPKISYDYAKEKGLENTPEEIRKIAIEYMKFFSQYASEYAQERGLENTPIEILKIIPSDVYNYAKEKGWENIKDEEIREIAIEFMKENLIYSYYYVLKRGWGNTPVEIRQIFIEYSKKNPYNVYQYVKEKGLENTPLEILKIPKVAYYYALDNGWENTPLEILKIPAVSYNYVKEKGWENIKDEEIRQSVIEYMKENPDSAYVYVTKWGWENIPEEIRQLAIERMKENPAYASEYAQERGWENTPKEIRKIAIDYIKEDPHFTNFNFIETINDKELIQLFKELPNYKKWYEIPKKEAQKYNKQLGGLFIHSMQLNQAEYTLSPSDELKGELCVSSIAADTTFRSEIIVVGRGELRLLFPFDCYSVEDGNGLRYGTTSAWMIEKLGEIEDEEEQKEKMKELGIEEIKGSYYDEGFIRPNDAEWLLITGEYKNIVQKLSNKLGIKYVDIEEFNDALKSENLNKFYDLIQGNLDQEPHEYDDLYESFSSVEIFKLKLRDIVS